MLPSLGPRRRAAAWRVWSVALLAPGQQQGLAVLGAQVLGPSQVLTPPAGHQRNGETGDLRAFSREFTSRGGERVGRWKHAHWIRRRGFCDVTRP